jgi:hypothetical protein
MPSFESPLGNKSFSSTQFKEVNVPDESGYSQSEQLNQRSVEDVEREIKEAREIKRSGKERLSDGAKKRLEMLLGMTRTTRVVKLGDTEFELQSLKDKETREAMTSIAKYDGSIETPYEVRKQFLARSIVSIANISFEQFIGSSNLNSKLEFLEEMDDAFLTALYNEYRLLVQDANNKFAVKTETQVKEVLEDLKK